MLLLSHSIEILNKELGALAQGLLVPVHREVSRDRGASQGPMLSSCFNQVSRGLGDSRIHKACWGRRLGLRKNTGENLMVPWIQAESGQEHGFPTVPRTNLLPGDTEPHSRGAWWPWQCQQEEASPRGALVSVNRRAGLLCPLQGKRATWQGHYILILLRGPPSKGERSFSTKDRLNRSQLF